MYVLFAVNIAALVYADAGYTNGGFGEKIKFPVIPVGGAYPVPAAGIVAVPL